MECPELGLPGTFWALGTTKSTARPQPRSCSGSSRTPGHIQEWAHVSVLRPE